MTATQHPALAPETVATDRIRARNESAFRASAMAMCRHDIDEFARHWTDDGRYEVAYPVSGLPAVVEGRDQLRQVFGAMTAATERIEVHDVRFHQTEDPDVAFVEERMIADLRGGGTYENTLAMRVTFRDGLIREIYEYCDQVAHQGLVDRLLADGSGETTARNALHGPGLTDVRMMVVVHSTFRRELRLGVSAVRATRDGSRPRTTEVCDHVELFLGSVHHHHTIEDELLWDTLAARVPGEVAHLVDLMQEQHAGVHDKLVRAQELVTRWRATCTAEDRDALADSLGDFVDALFEHLATEEEHVLPLMARHLTDAEWDEFARQGMAAIPRRLTLVGFGMMLYEGDPDAVAVEIAKMPAPLRPLLPALGRRAYRRYALRLHGTETPERVSHR